MSSDQTLARPNNEISTNTDGGKKILSEQSATDFAPINDRSSVSADSAAMVASSTLPPLQIDGHESASGQVTPATGDVTPASQQNPVMEFFHDAATVVSDVGTGAWNELTQHPLEVLEAGATGLAIGVGITAAAVLIAPEVAVAATVVGLGYGAVQLAQHVPGWMHDAGIVSNPENFSAAEVAQAHTDFQDAGRGTTLLAAGVVGGLPSGMVFSAAEGAVGDILAANANLSVADTVTPAAQTVDAVANTDSTPNAVPEASEPLPTAPLTVDQSIEINQGLFRSAQDEIVPSVKQSYQVRFEQVGPEGRLVPTLEKPEGVLAPEGSWVATRLNADGTPNIENGMTNSWTIKEPAILKTYKLTADQLAANPDIVGWTNTEAPPVHMVQLKEPIDIETKWGSMHGDAGSWLANYDYDPATGQPGSNYAIVTAKSYGETYKPV